MLSAKELMFSSCGAREDSCESLGQQRDQNQWILKEINPKYSLEGLMLKLKLQFFGHLKLIADSMEKNPDTGKDCKQEEKEATEMR